MFIQGNSEYHNDFDKKKKNTNTGCGGAQVLYRELNIHVYLETRRRAHRLDDDVLVMREYFVYRIRIRLV